MVDLSGSVQGTAGCKGGLLDCYGYKGLQWIQGTHCSATVRLEMSVVLKISDMKCFVLCVFWDPAMRKG